LKKEPRELIRSILWAVAALGFLASLVSAAQRWRVESRNRSVEITLDFQEIRTLAVAEGKTLGDVLREFKKAGVTSIALQEDTVGGLEEAKLVELSAGGDPETSLVLSKSPESANRITEALGAKLGRTTTIAKDAGPNAFTVPLPHSAIRSLGLGLDSRLVGEIHGADLAVVGRVANYNGVRPEGIRWTLDGLKTQGVTTVIFLGDEALGFKGYLIKDSAKPNETTTDTALQSREMNVGAVEFSKQKGDAALAKAVVDRVVRVHTILGAEMLTATIPSNIQRFELAARERNIRLLYVRLFLDEKEALNENVKYIEKLVKGLERGDLVPGQAHPYDPLSTSLPLRGLIGLGIAAGWLLLVDSVTRFLRGGTGLWIGAIAFGGALILFVLPMAPMLLGAKLAAFAGAIIYPTLALIHSDVLEKMHLKRGLLPALKEFLLACAVTGLGIAAVVGLLADRLFLVKVDGFMGVKVSNLLPVVLVWLAYALPLRATDAWTFRRALSETGGRLRDWATKSVQFWQVAVAVVALGALALLVLRTGNDPGVGVSPLELRFRALLDQILYVRPRFKEFLIGHPALLLALLAAGRGRRDLAVPLLAVGAIGQASMLGTFCHLHTPLPVCLIRALLGLVIGVIIGSVIYAVITAMEKRAANSSAANTVSGESAPEGSPVGP
jgi:hypothetical protein